MAEKTKVQNEGAVCACTTKTWVWVLLIVFISLFVLSLHMAICGWYLYMQKNDNNTEHEDILTAIESSQIVAEEDGIDANSSDSKVYHNHYTERIFGYSETFESSKYGFRLSFPDVWDDYRGVTTGTFFSDGVNEECGMYYGNNGRVAQLTFNYPSQDERLHSEIDDYGFVFSVSVYDKVLCQGGSYYARSSVIGENEKYVIVAWIVEDSDIDGSRVPNDLPEGLYESVQGILDGIELFEPEE